MGAHATRAGTAAPVIREHALAGVIVLGVAFALVALVFLATNHRYTQCERAGGIMIHETCVDAKTIKVVEP
jgi:hypothetical protein